MNSKLNIVQKVTNVGYITRVLYWPFIRLLIWSMTLDKRLFIKFGSRIESLWIHNGNTFLCLYLKECLRVTQHYISGNSVTQIDSGSVPIALTGGLPSIIPGDIRLLIKSKSSVEIRGTLTMFSLYRIIKIPGNPKLSTITDPFKGLYNSLPSLEIAKVVKTHYFEPKLKIPTLLFLSASSSSYSSSFLGIWSDILIWSKGCNKTLLIDLYEFLEIQRGSEFIDLINRTISEFQFYDKDKLPNYLGRLSLKQEAAGKVRVFAIADSITQSAMKPLHDFIFSLLKTFPTDGTFDQNAPISRLIQLKRDGIISKSELFYSYDLSAATDRLPISLQKDILSQWFGTKFSTLWSNLLINRSWHLKDSKSFPGCSGEFKYSVGQPMGALSSWGMLAYTHHVIVQVAANRVGINNFNHYALLGDDIVICNNAVAASYHTLMTEWLGVDINLSKSLVSSDVLEFAKRLVTVDGEYTPVGVKNLLVGLKSLNGIPSILRDLKQKGFLIDEAKADAYVSSIPTVRKSSLKDLLWTIKGPFGFIPSETGLTSSMRLVNSLTSVRIDSLISSIEDAKHRLQHDNWAINVRKMHQTINKFENLTTIPVLEIEQVGGVLHRYIINRLYTDLFDLNSKEPVRRFFFNGPLIHFGTYSDNWAVAVYKHIAASIHEFDTP